MVQQERRPSREGAFFSGKSIIEDGFNQVNRMAQEQFDTSREPLGGAPHTNLFGGLRDAQKMDELTEDGRVKDLYSDDLFGQVARHKYFEITTMCFICLNALAIGYDADYSARYHKAKNLYKGPLEFIIIENIFAFYFTIELLTRFLAYSKKISLFSDRWFMFDSILVALMVMETWILPNFGDGGPFKGLSVLRLLRLARITRMARLMRACPEMVLLVKGMLAAVRAVVWTVILLLVFGFTFAIMFTNEYHIGADQDKEDATEAEATFGRVGWSFLNLLIMGTILDDLTYAMDAVRASEKGFMVCAFLFFILVSSFMMLNMFLGILVEVVASSSEGEKIRLQSEMFREAVNDTLGAMDNNSDKKITRSEFFELTRESPKVLESLESMDVQGRHLDAYGELLFQDEEPNHGLTYSKITDMVLRLRPGAPVQSLDFNALSKIFTHEKACQMKKYQELEKKARELRDSCKTSKKLREAAPCTAEVPQGQIGVDTLARVDEAPTWCIVKELQRRLCVGDAGETIPLHMLDEEMQSLVQQAWDGAQEE
jgi:voltage-gated sodium channel